MITKYLKKQGTFYPVDNIENNTWVSVESPWTSEEFSLLAQQLQVPVDFLTDALDIDERPRYQEDEGSRLIVLKVPVENNTPSQRDAFYVTLPIGIVITPNNITTINTLTNIQLKDIFVSINTFEPKSYNTIILNIFEYTIKLFLLYLKNINLKSNTLEKKLYNSSTNDDLLEFMQIQKSLVYFVTSLRSNELLMMKLERTNFLQLNETEQEKLHDLIIDASQALEMANTYTNIHNNAMESFANIISNNQNQVLKKLTTITIVLQLPVLVTSVYGMNIPLPYQESRYAFYVLVGLSSLLAFIIGVLFLQNKK